MIRFVVIAAVAVMIVAVAADNRDDVRLGYVFGDSSAPLWLVIVVAVAVGLVLGWLLRFRRRD